MTADKKKRSRKKTWKIVIHDHGGYVIFDEKGHLVGRFANVEVAAKFHASTLQSLLSLLSLKEKAWPVKITRSAEIEMDLPAEPAATEPVEPA